MNSFWKSALRRAWLVTLVIFSSFSVRGADPKPVLTGLSPRGLQRGETVTIQVTGSNLVALTAVKFTNTNLNGVIVATRTNEATVQIRSAPRLPRGAYEFSVVSPNGTSGPLQLDVDDVPQLFLRETNPAPRALAHPDNITALPMSVWGALENPGDVDAFAFEGRAGETLVLDFAAKALGSKLTSGSLILLNAEGRVVAANSSFDGGEPLLAFTPEQNGRFIVRVSDQMAGGSKDHFYRLTIGALPFVTGVFPLGVAANQESAVELIGWNLGKAESAKRKAETARDTPSSATTLKVKAGASGELEVPIDPESFRTRRNFKVLVGTTPETIETEPNDTTATANALKIPGAVNGRLFTPDSKADADLFRFHAVAGQRLVIETQAAQRGSPADTKIEILDLSGRPVPRLKLQAVRDSLINFRAIDSIQQGARLDNWEEMELDNYIYFNGDVARLLRMPQGPDSDLLFYLSAGKRRAYFDTNPTGHALEEPCYVVEPRALDARLVANGLPVFTVYYGNDDDAERRLGSDSKVHFTPVASGHYLVRVSDARGFSGDRFAYRLVVRDAKPDFTVTLNGANPTVPRGSGQSFSVNVERVDGFEDEILVDLTNVPPGLIVSTPLRIEAGHSEVKGAVFALTNAVSMTNSSIKVTATAIMDGKRVIKEVNSLGMIKAADAPKLFVAFEPFTSLTETNLVEPPDGRPFEITISPGQTAPAWLKIRRNGHQELVTFQVENLPHGVIVDNIGLNGVLIPKEQNERQIFLNCARWVGDQDRLCYAIEQNAGRQTSRPLLLKVRRAPAAAAR
jgi:hypothetical protein